MLYMLCILINVGTHRCMFMCDQGVHIISIARFCLQSLASLT